MPSSGAYPKPWLPCSDQRSSASSVVALDLQACLLCVFVDYLLLVSSVSCPSLPPTHLAFDQPHQLSLQLAASSWQLLQLSLLLLPRSQHLFKLSFLLTSSQVCLLHQH